MHEHDNDVCIDYIYGYCNSEKLILYLFVVKFMTQIFILIIAIISM